MNALFGVAILTGILYGFFIDGTFFKLYFGVLVVYHVVTQILLTNRKELTKRKAILVTTWDGNIINLIDFAIRPWRSSLLYPNQFRCHKYSTISHQG